MTHLKLARDCKSMAELRQQIDGIDLSLIEMFVQRTHYIDRVVDLKPAEGLPARTTDRVAEALRNVREKAETVACDPDLAEAVWTELIEWSIRREGEHLGDYREPDSCAAQHRLVWA